MPNDLIVQFPFRVNVERLRQQARIMEINRGLSGKPITGPDTTGKPNETGTA